MRDSKGSQFCKRPDLAWIACCCLASMALARFIIFWALWPMYPQSTGPAPYFFSSIRSDQTEVCPGRLPQAGDVLLEPFLLGLLKGLLPVKVFQPGGEGPVLHGDVGAVEG